LPFRKWNITDVYGLDDEMLDMVPKPVASLLLLFPITAKVLELEKEKQEQIADEKNVVQCQN
jgi:ubiquitin carboxyl-terminal hydrolase L3